MTYCVELFRLMIFAAAWFVVGMWTVRAVQTKSADWLGVVLVLAGIGWLVVLIPTVAGGG